MGVPPTCSASPALGPAAVGQDEPAKKDEPAPKETPAKPDEPAGQAPEKLPGPPPIPQVQLGPVLKTTPMARRPPGPNQTMVDASVLPKDRQGIWVLDFSFKPVRLVTVEVNGRRKQLHYFYYRVVNRTGKPRDFVPQFTLVTDTGKRYEDVIVPQAVKIVQKREDPHIDVFGSVDIIGSLPPSTKEAVDDTVTGVALWENVDPHADGFKIYIRGLSDGYQIVVPPGGDKSKEMIRYKTLRVDFTPARRRAAG